MGWIHDIVTTLADTKSRTMTQSDSKNIVVGVLLMLSFIAVAVAIFLIVF